MNIHEKLKAKNKYILKGLRDSWFEMQTNLKYSCKCKCGPWQEGLAVERLTGCHHKREIGDDETAIVTVLVLRCDLSALFSLPLSHFSICFLYVFPAFILL